MIYLYVILSHDLPHLLCLSQIQRIFPVSIKIILTDFLFPQGKEVLNFYFLLMTCVSLSTLNSEKEKKTALKESNMC